MSASSSGVIVGVVVGNGSDDGDADGAVGGTDGRAGPLGEAAGPGEVPGGDPVGAVVEQATTARRKAGSSAARRMSGTSNRGRSFELSTRLSRRRATRSYTRWSSATRGMALEPDGRNPSLINDLFMNFGATDGSAAHDGWESSP